MAKTSKSSPAARKTLVLLDAHAIIHRAYHALPDFSSSKGVATGALYGLSSMLFGIIEKFKPEYIVACYDLPEPTYRHVAYADYKAGRRKADDALVEQLESSRKLFEVFGIPIFDHPGFEADDMLGTIVEQIHGKPDPEGAEVKIVIASGDMDTMQLISGDEVVVYTLKKGIKDIVVYDELAVIERFGFAPKLLPDYKGLRGDPSDNIIGIAGIGEKTATTIISIFGTVEDMYAALDADRDDFVSRLKAGKITDRIIGLIENGRDDALFSKALATIRRDAPITFDFDQAKWETHTKRVEEYLRDLEIRSLIPRMHKVFGTSADMEVSSENVKEVVGSKTSSSSSAPESKTKKGKESGKKTDVSDDEFSTEGLESYAEAQEQSENSITPHAYLDADIELQEKLKVAVWILDSNKTNPTLDDVYAETGEPDAAKAYEILSKNISDQGMGYVLDSIEVPLIAIVRKMSADGAMVDISYLKKLSKEYHANLDRLEKEIHKMAGMEFNVASPKQLGEVLYDKLGLGGAGSGARIKKTAGGAKSTKESELEKLRDAHPIVGKILEYRELAKLLGTYIDVLPTHADSNDRVHTLFSQTGSMTGRMSSQNPGLQNIPIKTELGKKVRHAFIAPKGKKLVSIDYSQIELRIAAIVSGDKNLVDIFKNGTDVHTGVAARVFKVDESKVTSDMRRRAKVINFGILYGMGVTALRMNLSAGVAAGEEPVSREDAQNFYNEYFNTFTGIATYLEEVKRSATVLGYTKTVFGRRRYFEGIKSKLPFIKAAAERTAINAPIQGTGADIMKLAMQKVSDSILSQPKFGATMILQVHDELVFEIDEKKAESTTKQIQEIMEGILKECFEEYKKSGGVFAGNDGGDKASSQHDIEKRVSEVPLLVSVSIGNNWGELK